MFDFNIKSFKKINELRGPVSVMPTVLRIRSYRFHFYSDEGKEPPHIHIATSDGECKFWLEPVRLARNKGVSPKMLRDIEKLVFDNLILLKDKYYEINSP